MKSIVECFVLIWNKNEPFFGFLRFPQRCEFRIDGLESCHPCSMASSPLNTLMVLAVKREQDGLKLESSIWPPLLQHCSLHSSTHLQSSTWETLQQKLVPVNSLPICAALACNSHPAAPGICWFLDVWVLGHFIDCQYPCWCSDLIKRTLAVVRHWVGN